MKPLRIVIVDDHEIVRKGVRTALEGHPGWQIAGEADNGRSAIALVEQCKPDIVIMDIGMPELNGLEATRRLLTTAPQTRVLILTMYESEQMVHEALAAGARGYLFKSDSYHLIIAAVEALARGGSYFTPKVTELLLARYLSGTLTPPEVSKLALQPTSREREVVQLVAEGKTSKEIAQLLNIAIKTVETHRAHIMAKLDLHSVSDLVRYAIRNMIIKPE